MHIAGGTTSDIKVDLEVNGAAQNNQQANCTTAGGVEFICSLTVIVNIPTVGSTLSCVNTGPAISLNNSNGTTGGVKAFMTIVKLQ